MATLRVNYYQAICDTCGSGYEDPGGEGIVAWEFPSDAVLAAMEIGWHYAEERLTCPGCLRCAVCGEQPAWVGGPELDSPGQILCEDCDIATVPPVPSRHLVGIDRRLALVPSVGTSDGT